MHEMIRVLVFVGTVGLVYVAAGTYLFRRWVLKRRGRVGTLEKTVYSLATLGIACMAYGYFVEPYWPQVRRVTIETPKLAPGSGALRVVLLSDMHSDFKRRLEERLPKLVAKEAPALILFAGDSVNEPEGLDNFRYCMRELARIAPVFAVRGNWDSFTWPELALFEGTGVRELINEAVLIKPGGLPVWVAGVAAHRQRDANEALRGVPRGALTLFLHHYPYPDILTEENRVRVDLFGAGHVHGGQVALPFYGALLTLSRFGKTYESGFYKVGAMPLYVTRGIGMDGGLAPRVRFCARPEITVIDFIPAATATAVSPGP